MTQPTNIETTLTQCDACQATKRCAKLGPDGHYTLALCAECYAPLAAQLRAEIANADAAAVEARADMRRAYADWDRALAAKNAGVSR